MTDRHFFKLATEHFTIEGRSRAGHETYFRIRELNLALDIGRCPDFLIGVPNIFITHAHLDHAAGIPFYAGQRRLQALGTGVIYVPEETVTDFQSLMAIHERLEGIDYQVQFVGMGDGTTRRIARNLAVRAHLASHRVAARAYEVLELRHHLKPEFEGLGGRELAALRYQGTVVDQESEVPILFYTGDTDRVILEQNSAIYRAGVLILECSFIDEGHEDRAARYRHVHFDDVAEFADRFENEIVLLSHFSRRYTPEHVVTMLRRRCPSILRDRIRLAFPEPWQKL